MTNAQDCAKRRCLIGACALPPGEWCQRDLQAELDRLFPGQQLVRVTGIRIEPRSGQTVQLKDIPRNLRCSNSITVEHPPSSRLRRTGTRAAAGTSGPAHCNLDEGGFHYDQVGSVLSESDASGNLSAMHYQDAFGVRQEDWATGVPGGTRDGWAHNTKEPDPGTGLLYMYQRHYVPEYGMFVSRAPYEVIYEHEYTFAGQNPVTFVDPRGEQYSEGYYLPEMWTSSPPGPLPVGPPMDLEDLSAAGGAVLGAMNLAGRALQGINSVLDPLEYLPPPSGGAEYPHYGPAKPFTFYALQVPYTSCRTNADRNTAFFNSIPGFRARTSFISYVPDPSSNWGHAYSEVAFPGGDVYIFDNYVFLIFIPVN